METEMTDFSAVLKPGDDVGIVTKTYTRRIYTFSVVASIKRRTIALDNGKTFNRYGKSRNVYRMGFSEELIFYHEAFAAYHAQEIERLTAEKSKFLGEIKELESLVTDLDRRIEDHLEKQTMALRE